MTGDLFLRQRRSGELTYQEIQNLKTPCYIIDEDKFINNVNQIREAFEKEWDGKLVLAYSIKTNHNREMLKCAGNIGMYAEAVSDDEYIYAEKSGFLGNEILYNGVQKTEDGLLRAVHAGSLINLDNMEEIRCIEEHISEFSRENMHIGLRVNFDLEKECPGETTAGKEVSRFGFCVENGDLEWAIRRLRLMEISPEGLHMHYSTKSRSLSVFSALAKKACEISELYNLKDEIRYIDIGGGFFGGQKVEGKPSMHEYAKTICGILKKTFPSDKVSLILEPGASVAATAIDYVSRVVQVKDIRNVRIVTLDGSNIDINPFLAQREPVCEVFSISKKHIPEQIICGATCMENDRILKLVDGVKLEKNDILCIHFAGAYTMAFNNSFINLPPYIYWKKQEEYLMCRDKYACFENGYSEY